VAQHHFFGIYPSTYRLNPVLPRRGGTYTAVRYRVYSHLLPTETPATMPDAEHTEPSADTPARDNPRSPLAEVARLFLRLGVTAFGGPAAHIALMHDETVKRRQWLDDQAFLDLVGATNLIPGPNSTEMAIHLGYLRAGWPGLVVGGLCFIVPAMLIVLALAWAYAEYGNAPEAQWLLYGIKPVIIAIVAQALWVLGRKAVNRPLTLAAGAGTLLGYAFGLNEIALLFSAGILTMLVENRHRLRELVHRNLHALAALPLAAPGIEAHTNATPFSLTGLFLAFLKIGSVLYGSGYVLLAFLHSDFVMRLGWLTDRQLIDAVAVGQFTPGPVFTTATFIGYLMGGTSGALLATLGIFLPSFIFVAVSSPFIPKLRQSPWFGSLLDGLNAASLGLMAAVAWQLGMAALVDPLTGALALAALVLLMRYSVNSTWLIAGGALIGWLSWYAG